MRIVAYSGVNRRFGHQHANCPASHTGTRSLNYNAIDVSPNCVCYFVADVGYAVHRRGRRRRRRPASLLQQPLLWPPSGWPHSTSHNRPTRGARDRMNLQTPLLGGERATTWVVDSGDPVSWRSLWWWWWWWCDVRLVLSLWLVEVFTRATTVGVQNKSPTHENTLPGTSVSATCIYG